MPSGVECLRVHGTCGQALDSSRELPRSALCGVTVLRSRRGCAISTWSGANLVESGQVYRVRIVPESDLPSPMSFLGREGWCQEPFLLLIERGGTRPKGIGGPLKGGQSSSERHQSSQLGWRSLQETLRSGGYARGCRLSSRPPRCA